MVEEAQTFHTRLYNSYGAMGTIGEFLSIKEIVCMQACNKHFYDNVVPKMRTKVELPTLNLVLESARKSISIGFWRDNVRQVTQ